MSNPMNRHQDLKAILDRLKLTGMAKHFSDLALREAYEGLSHEAYLHEPSLGRKRLSDRNDAQNGFCVLRACHWRKPSEHSISSGSPPPSNSKSSDLNRELSWSKRSM